MVMQLLCFAEFLFIYIYFYILNKLLLFPVLLSLLNLQPGTLQLTELPVVQGWYSWEGGPVCSLIPV